jgi:hypothetical protein
MYICISRYLYLYIQVLISVYLYIQVLISVYPDTDICTPADLMLNGQNELKNFICYVHIKSYL